MQARTLLEAINYFSDEDKCIAFVRDQRWPDGNVICPRCGRADASWVESRKVWQCKSRHAKRTFSIKVGTIFEDSPIPLSKWLPAVWLIASAKNGISSYELGRSIGVTQKSAWFMLHRIRFAMQDGEQAARDQQSRLENEREKRFRALADWWHSQTDLLSSPDAKIEHRAYREIIEDMGSAAVPYILRDLRSRGGQWYQALMEITGITPPLPPGTPYSLRAEHQAWLDWGVTQGI